MKLKVYQQGGGLIYTPFIPEQWAGQESKSGSGSSGSDDKIDPLDKELINLMKDQNLLPNDIKVIYNRLLQFQRKSRELTATGDYRSVMPGMLQIMQLANVAKTNKDTWDAALNEIRKHNAGSEVAIDSWGRMWVKDSETSQITKIAPGSFDSERYIPLSNSELLYLRQRDPSLAFSDDALNTMITDVVGQKDVQNEIDSIIQNFGKVAKDRFAKGSRIKEIAGDIIDGDIYKIGTKYSKADLNDFSGLLFSELSAPSQNLLRARAAMAGNGVLDYIGKMIFSQTDVEENISYDASASKAVNGNGDDGGSDKLVLSTYEEHLVWGDFDEGKRQLIQPGNSDVAIYAYVQDVGPIKKDNNDFGSANLDKVFTQADSIGTLIDKSNIFFGDHRVTSNEFSRIMYDNQKNMKRVELPIKEDGSIDFSAQQKADQIQEYLKRNGGMVPDELIEEQLEDVPGAYWDRDQKKIKFRNTNVFFVVEAVASSELVSFDTDSPYINKQQEDSSKDYTEMYNNAINSGYANVPSDPKKNPYDNGNTRRRHLYRANLYMPVSGQVIATALYNHERLPVSDYMAGTPTNMARINNDRQTVKSNF